MTIPSLFRTTTLNFITLFRTKEKMHSVLFESHPFIGNGNGENSRYSHYFFNTKFISKIKSIVQDTPV